MHLHPDRSRCDADVIVVGAGPAGSSAAAALAQRGHRVVMLEAETFPRDKVCGDVLLEKMDGALRSVGTSLDELAPEARVLTGCALTMSGGARGRRVEGSFRGTGGETSQCRVLPRRLFDERLARHAERAGAELRERHRLVGLVWDSKRHANRLEVDHDGRARIYTAPLVIGADGARSRVARERGLAPPDARPRAYSAAVRTYVDWRAVAPVFEVFVHSSFPRGCCWIVPAPGGQANVGAGTFEAASRPTQAELLGQLRRLAGDLMKMPDAPAFTGWALPSPSLRRPTIGDGVMLVGDAAGFVDPFTGHGIHNAVASGVLAAGAASRALDTGRVGAADLPLRSYQRAWRRAFFTDFLIGRLLQRVHGNLGLLAALLARASDDQRWADRLMALVGHAGPRTQVLRPGFLIELLRSTV